MLNQIIHRLLCAFLYIAVHVDDAFDNIIRAVNLSVPLACCRRTLGAGFTVQQVTGVGLLIPGEFILAVLSNYWQLAYAIKTPDKVDPRTHETFTQSWLNVGPAGPTFIQVWVNVSCWDGTGLPVRGQHWFKCRPISETLGWLPVGTETSCQAAVAGLVEIICRPLGI